MLIMNESEKLGDKMNELVLRISVLEHQVLRAKDQIIGDHARNG